MPFPNKATQFKPGQSGNPKGRPKGSVSLATVIKELEREDFDWSLVPVKQKDVMAKYGAPWRAIVGVAIAKACGGDIKAAEWLAKFGYGEKIRMGGIETNEIKIVIVNEEEQSGEE